MGVKYTPEQVAKMGLKIHGEKRGDLKAVSGVFDSNGSKTPVSDQNQKIDGEKRVRKSVKNPGTDCSLFLLLLRQELGVEAVEEHVFHDVRKWRFDVAILSHKIAIEIEGGIWRQGGGAHSHPANITRDIEKYNAATVLGWKILRVVPEDLTKTKTIKMIKQLITRHEH